MSISEVAELKDSMTSCDLCDFCSSLEPPKQLASESAAQLAGAALQPSAWTVPQSVTLATADAAWEAATLAAAQVVSDNWGLPK